MARITLTTDSYNPRRDGKPWICRVTDWPVGASKPEIAWGAWMGSPGDAGELVVEAAPGDVLRWGQNDLRRSNHTYRQYGIVEGDLTVREVTDAEAAEHYQTRQVQPASLVPTPEQVQALIDLCRDLRIDPCPDCEGSGIDSIDDTSACRRCGGTGEEVERPHPDALRVALAPFEEA